jgi:hypothetical protein
MSQLGNDPIVQKLMSLGLPVTKENWLDHAFPDGMQGAEEFELIPPEIWELKDGEELKLSPTTTSRSKGVPGFEKGLRANFEQRKKTSGATSKGR